MAARIFKSTNVILDADKLPVDNALPDILFTPAAADAPKPFAGTVEEALSEQEDIIRAANEEAGRIAAEASHKAEMILADARVQCDRLKADTLKQAKTDGYAEGFARGKAEADELIRLQQQENEAAARERAEMIAAVEPQMVDLAIRAIREITGDICRITPGAVTALIRAGLAEATTAGDVKVRVHPDDVDNVMTLRKTLSAYVDTGAKLSIIKDPGLNPLDCVIETAFGAVDCSLEQQLDGLAQNLLVILKAAQET